MTFGKAKLTICLPVFICFSFVLTLRLPAQVRVSPDRYRIEFTDKEHNQYTTDLPHYFLSERSLQRRIKQGISLVQADLPVSAYYTDSLERMNIKVLNTSRWFNSATVLCTEDDIERLKGVDFIKQTATIRSESVKDTTVDKEYDLGTLFSFLFPKKEQTSKALYAAPAEYYGKAADQIGMMNGQVLHNRGFRGKGMLIAIIDGGFYRVNELSGFDSLRQDGRLLGVKNFTTDNDGLWGENNHGTNVFSIIASNLPGRMIGSAPDATYVLLRSEETSGEYLVEEDNWITAVEYADSIGADLITSSLGYSVFDDASQNHSYRDLDGRTVRASYAATMAATRGMIVCVSAGNDGDTHWKYISVPADADSVVTVGAVDRNGKYAPFSSVGYTADRRIKPDLTAMGKETAYQSSSGNINTGNGTSYSTPLLAGLIACLWQAYPDKGNMEIIDMVKRSADRYHKPDSLHGAGIPDFSKLMESTTSSPEIKVEPPYEISVFPNPFTGTFTLYLSPTRHGRVDIRIYTISGQQIFSHTGYTSEYDAYELLVGESSGFAAGIYIIEARTQAGRVTVKAVKQ